ncbi:hypothetical protein NKH18_01105 [Streptomyces sp. M10(2022)]
MPLPYFEVDVPIHSTEAPGQHGLHVFTGRADSRSAAVRIAHEVYDAARAATETGREIPTDGRTAGVPADTGPAGSPTGPPRPPAAGPSPAPSSCSSARDSRPACWLTTARATHPVRDERETSVWTPSCARRVGSARAHS